MAEDPDDFTIKEENNTKEATDVNEDSKKNKGLNVKWKDYIRYLIAMGVR